MPRIPLAALSLVAALGTAGTARSNDATGLLADWAAAYVAGDKAQVARLYTPDARLWSEASPREAVGQAEVGYYFATIGIGPAPLGIRIDAHNLREMSSVVLVSGRYTLVRERWDGSIAEEPCRFTLALLRAPDGGWRIAEQHSSRLPATPR